MSITQGDDSTSHKLDVYEKSFSLPAVLHVGKSLRKHIMNVRWLNHFLLLKASCARLQELLTTQKEN